MLQQVREMRFHCANGLVVLRICAPSVGALVVKIALYWQQCFSTHSINQGGQTCLLEESFAENQKHQRVAKPICSVNTNTVKNASFTLNNVQ